MLTTTGAKVKHLPATPLKPEGHELADKRNRFIYPSPDCISTLSFQLKNISVPIYSMGLPG